MNSVAYLNSTVYCRLQPSPIHGVGVFAIREIKKGTKISDYDYSNIENGVMPLRLSVSELPDLVPEIQQLIFDRMIFDESDADMLVFFSPNHDQCLRSFMNHSNTPNSDGEIALRDIEKGEEVTEDFTSLVKNLHLLTKKHHTYL